MVTVPTTIDVVAWPASTWRVSIATSIWPWAMLAAFAEADVSAGVGHVWRRVRGAVRGSHNSLTAIGSGIGIPGWARSIWPSPSCGRAPITRTGCSRRCRRAEQALVAVIGQAYVEGVSTRRLDHLVRAMGVESISRSQVSRMAAELDAKGGRVPRPAPRCRTVSVSVDLRVDPEGARERPGGQRLGGDRHRGQRREPPGDRRLRHRDH